MSETLAPEIRWLVLGAGREGSARLRRPRRRVVRLKARVVAQERELLRRQQTTLALASEVHSLREALDLALRERAELARRLRCLGEVRASERAEASKLAEALRDQQLAVRELESSVTSLIGARS